jgi:hypothetical protein
MKVIDFVLYIGKFDDETDFQPAKIYPILEPIENDPIDYLRVLDESGEDYLYPKEYFQIVQLTNESRVALTKHFEISLS